MHGTHDHQRFLRQLDIDQQVPLLVFDGQRNARRLARFHRCPGALDGRLIQYGETQ